MASNLRRHITKTHIVRYDSNIPLIYDALLIPTRKGTLASMAPLPSPAEDRSQEVSRLSGERIKWFTC